MITPTPAHVPGVFTEGFVYKQAFQCLKVRLQSFDELVAFRLGDVIVQLTSRPQRATLLAGFPEITNDYKLNTKSTKPADVEFSGSVYLILSFHSDDAEKAASEGRTKFEVALGYIEVILGERFVFNKLYEQTIDVKKRSPQFILDATLNPGFFEFHDVVDSALEEAASRWDEFAAMEVKCRNRLALALRWYQRSLLQKNADDRFLSLWVAFEVIAMRGASDLDSGIDFVKAKLAPDLSREMIKTRLLLGELFGCRGSIVHDGEAVMEHWNEERIVVLKDIVSELLRAELSLAPRGTLKQRLDAV